MKLDEAIEVELFASDPMLAKPIHMNFDPQGRLWVACSSVYPQLLPGEKANDRIIVLEDLDGDGKADKSTVFVEGLLIPTGVLPDAKGVYVAASTQLLYFSDTDGDGKADTKQVVLSGFGTEDTHHLLHTLRWGPDGWMYMNQSIYIHSHVETPWGTKRLDGGGIWRFHPASQKLEIVCKGFVNPWGHVFDPWGQSFATDGAYGEGINYVFPGSVFVTAPGFDRFVSGLNPGSPKHCGLEILSGSHIPPEWRGQMIANDFRSHRVCRFQVSRTANGYVSQQQPEMIVSDHVAFRPIDTKMGPDGTLFLADWYNPIIQHGEVDFRDARRDREHGRIWRIRWKDRPVAKYGYREDASIEELLIMLENELELTRQWARLELAQRPIDQVESRMETWVSKAKDELQFGQRLLERVWLNESRDRHLQLYYFSLVEHSDPRLRAIGVRSISRRWEALNNLSPSLEEGDEAEAFRKEQLTFLARAVQDEDWQVRLEALCALRHIPTAESVSVGLGALDSAMNDYLDFTLWSLIRDHDSRLPEWIASQDVTNLRADQLIYVAKATRSHQVLERVLAHFRNRGIPPDENVVQVLAERCDPALGQKAFDWLCESVDEIGQDRFAVLLSRFSQWTASRNMRPANIEQKIPDLLSGELSRQPEVTAALAQAAARWKVASVLPILEARFASLKNSVDRTDDLVRIVEGMAGIEGDESSSLLKRWAIDSELTPQIRASAIGGLARKDLQAAAQLCVTELTAASEENTTTYGLSQILSRREGGTLLRQALDAVSELPPNAARLILSEMRRMSLQDAALMESVQKAGRLDEHRWLPTEELIAKLSELARDQGDAKRGEELYRLPALQCQRCHPIGTAGGQIGPNLISIGGSSTLDYIIESLLDPDAKLKEGFQTIALLTAEDEIVSGLEKSRTDNQLQLLTAEGKLVAIDRSQIESERTGKSLMPSGLVDTLTLQQLADLVRFLSEVGRTPDYTVSTDLWIRSWQTARYTEAGHRVLNRTSVDALATDRENIQWERMVSKVNGRVPMSELDPLQPHREVPPFSALRSAFHCSKLSPIRFQWDGATDVRLWLDGRPVPLQNGDAVELAEGNHQVVVAINRGNEEFGLRLSPTSSEATVQLVDDF